MIKKIIIIFASIIFSASILGLTDTLYQHPLTTAQQDDFAKVQAQLSEPNTLKGNFKQIRAMKLLDKPLISAGIFELSKQQGLIWQQQQPFSSVMTVTESKITQKILDNPESVMTKAEQPVVFAFSNVFLSIFQGDTKHIQQYFKVYFIGNTQHWKIMLKPKEEPLNKAITSIELSGGKYVNKVIVNEVKQNTMTINFSNIQPA